MNNLSGKQKKLLGCMIAAGLAVNLAGGTATVNAKASAEGSTQSVEAEIADLTQRLTDLEAQLKAVKASEKATKAQVKKSDAKHKHDIKWSGSVKTGYWGGSNGKNKVKGQLKWYGDVDLKDDYHVGIGLKMKATSYEPSMQYKVDSKTGKVKGSNKYSNESTALKLEDAYVSKKITKNLLVSAGIQKQTVGNGLWIDKPGINSVSAKYNFTPRDSVQIGYGRDSLDKIYEDPATRTRILSFLDYRHNFSKDAYAGAYVGAQQPERYIGAYVSTPIVGKLWASAEYLHDTNTDKPAMTNADGSAGESGYYGYYFTGANKATNAYVFDLNYGKAKKKGSWGATLEWISADQNIFMDSEYSTWNDWLGPEGFKGFATLFTYMLSDNAKLQLIRYWGTNKPDGDNYFTGTHQSLDQRNLSNFYVKLTTKF